MKKRVPIILILAGVLMTAVYAGRLWLKGWSAGEILGSVWVAPVSYCATLLAIWAYRRCKYTSRAAVEKNHAKVLQDAFSDCPAVRKQLIDGIRHLMLRHFEQGERELEALKPICRTASDYCAVHTMLALWYQQRKEDGKALAELHVLEAMGLLNPDTLLMLQRLYVERKDLDTAERYGEAAIAAAPENSAGYNNMAYVAFYRNDLKKAIALAEKAAALDRHPHTCRFLAAAYQLDGQEALAKQYYRWALASGMPQRQIQARIDELCKDYAEMNQKETVL